MNRSELTAIADIVATRDIDALRVKLDEIASAGGTAKVGTWAYYANKLAVWIDGGFTGTAPFSIFAYDAIVSAHRILVKLLTR